MIEPCSVPDAGQVAAPSSSARARRIEAAIVLAVILAGSALRLYQVPSNALWLDEANTVLIASQSVPEMLHALRDDSSPPLYYLIVHYWIGMFGDGESGLRMLSALLGLLLAPALYFAARALFGRTAGLVAAVLGALSPLHIYYCHEVRMYSLVPLTTLGFFAALLAALDNHDGLSWKRWGLVAAAGVPVVWTHMFGHFAVMSAPLVWLARGPRTRQVALRLFAALAAVALSEAPWIPAILNQAGRGSAEWVANFFHAGSALLESLLISGAGYNYPVALRWLAGPSPAAPLSVLWFLVAAGTALWFGLRNAALRRSIAGIAAALIGTLGIPYLISVAWKPIVYVGRYDIGAYPAFALLLAGGAEAAWRASAGNGRWIRVGIAIMLCVYAGLASVWLAKEFRSRTPWRIEADAAEIVAEEASEADAIVTTGLSRASFEYYYRRARQVPGPVIESFPAEIAGHLGWFDAKTMRNEEKRLDSEAGDLVERLVRKGGFVYLIELGKTYADSPTTELLRRRLSYRAASEQLVVNGLDKEKRPIFTVTRIELRKS